MNWGWKMGIVYVGFVGIMISFVMRARNEKIDLVSSDYYEQEIAFADKMEAVKNANSLEFKPSISVMGEELHVAYPSTWNSSSAGKIRFYCPNDAKSDIEVAMQFSSGNPQIIAGELLKPGPYEVYFEWTESGKKYFVQQKIKI
jgi:nitrogen fixation protein FixH